MTNVSTTFVEVIFRVLDFHTGCPNVRVRHNQQQSLSGPKQLGRSSNCRLTSVGECLLIILSTLSWISSDGEDVLTGPVSLENILLLTRVKGALYALDSYSGSSRGTRALARECGSEANAVYDGVDVDLLWPFAVNLCLRKSLPNTLW